MRLLAVLAFVAFVSTASASAQQWALQPAPILTATMPWERAAVFEPTVLHENGLFKMWYSGGWDQCATGYATSRDGVHWAKYAGNPVLPAVACRNTIVHTATGYRIFYSDGIGAARDRIWTRDSRDGIHFGPPVLALEPPAWASALANTYVWEESGRWRMLFEGRVGETWQMGYADGDSPVTFGHVRRIPELDIGGHYGGAWIAPCNGGSCVYFHGGATGVLPSDIYVSETRDFRAFTRPALVFGRTLPWQVDQVADPSVVSLEDRDLMFFDADDNPNARAVIGVASLPAQPWPCGRA